MKAIAIDDYGLDHVEFRDVDDPEPGPGEIVVRVKAAALNHLDLWTLSGALGIKHDFPHVLGADGAGEIDAVGEGVPRGIKPGAAVMINPGLSCRNCELCRAGEHSLCPSFRMLGEHVSGTFGDKVKVPGTNVYPFPSRLSFAQAAALGTTYLTAYRMLFTRGRLRPGEWVLITGIGGGLAHSLFQLARPVAGKVLVTSSSPDKLKRAMQMGADEGVNYAEEDVGKAVRGLTAKRGVDLVVDSAGAPSIEAGVRCLRKGGRLITAGATAGPKAELDLRRVFWNQLEVVGSTMGSDSDVSDMLRMVGGTEITPEIDRTFRLSEGRQALEYLEGQEQFGKVVLETQ